MLASATMTRHPAMTPKTVLSTRGLGGLRGAGATLSPIGRIEGGGTVAPLRNHGCSSRPAGGAVGIREVLATSSGCAVEIRDVLATSSVGGTVGIREVLAASSSAPS